MELRAQSIGHGAWGVGHRAQSTELCGGMSLEKSISN